MRLDDVINEQWDIFGRANVFDGHTQKLVSRITVMPDGGFVNGQKSKGIQIIDPDRQRVTFKEQPVPRLRGVQCLRSLLPLSDIAHHRRDVSTPSDL